MANKVEFGISNLYVGTYSVGTTGTVTMGTPYHQAGAVSFSPEEQSESNNFYADNVIYWSGYSGGSFEGDLEVAKFDDTFKKNFLGYIQKGDGGLAIKKNVGVDGGVVDAGYRGEVCVLLRNYGKETVTFEPGDKVAQVVFHKITHALEKVDKMEDLGEGDRGANGFGSTGAK